MLLIQADREGGRGALNSGSKRIHPNVYKLQSSDQIIHDIRCVRSDVPLASDSRYHSPRGRRIRCDGFRQDALEADVPCNGGPSAVEEEEEECVFFVRGGPEVETKRWRAFAGTGPARSRVSYGLLLEWRTMIKGDWEIRENDERMDDGFGYSLKTYLATCESILPCVFDAAEVSYESCRCQLTASHSLPDMIEHR
jgi:hypothetical protein